MKKEIKPDVMELIEKMRQEIAVIGSKLDTFIGKSMPKPVEVKPFQQPANTQNQGNRSQGGNFRERVLHKAICADCKKQCEVPFKPSGERPVYCKDCFSKRKSGGPFKARPDNRPRVMPPAQVPHINKPEAVEKKKPAAKKKPASRKKKK